MHKRRKKLERNRDALADRLTKMKEHFTKKLTRTANRNKCLERTLKDKEKEIVNLLDTVERMEKVHTKKLFPKGEIANYSSKGNHYKMEIKRDLFSTPRSQSLGELTPRRSMSAKSTHEDLAAQTGMITISGDFILTTPTNSVTSSISHRAEAQLALPDFLASFKEFNNSACPAQLDNSDLLNVKDR